MKLYKREIADHSVVHDQKLIMESDSFSILKGEAERLAKADGCFDYEAWCYGDDGKYHLPHELNVNDRYMFVIRDW